MIPFLLNSSFCGSFNCVNALRPNSLCQNNVSSELHSPKNLPYDTNIGLGGWVASDMLFK
eukprot:m.196748 g.196748  ORF g.196748 m.196748 type:complete len:60 (-) comp15257_c0_seq3:3586-3765(-)